MKYGGKAPLIFKLRIDGVGKLPAPTALPQALTVIFYIACATEATWPQCPKAPDPM